MTERQLSPKFVQIGEEWKGGKNIRIKDKLIRFFLLWPIIIPFLYWSFLMTSLTRQYIIKPITYQGLILICDILVFFLIGLPAFIRIIPKNRSTEIPFLAVSKNKIFVLIGIGSIIFYSFIIETLWIPNLPLQYHNLESEYGPVTFVIAIIGVVSICVQYTIRLFVMRTKITVDMNNHVIVIQGKDKGGKRFFYNISFKQENIRLLLSPVLFTRDDSLSMYPTATIPLKNINSWLLF